MGSVARTMSDRLRFCLVTTFYPPYHFGGDGIFVYRLAQALAERGHSVEVVHSVDAYRLEHPADPDIDFSHHPNVRIHRLETSRPRLAALSAHQLGRPAAYARRLREVLEGNRYDVIHYHNISLMGGPVVLRWGRALKLYTPHEYWLICPTHVLFTFNREACTQRRCLRCTLHAGRPPQLWRYTRLMQRCARHVDRFLMPSRFAMERHRADGLDGPMTLLPHFVTAPATAVTADIPPEAEAPFFLFVGRLEKLKGVQDLIRLFADYREAPLLILGDGTYRSVLQEQARSLDHVKFLGRVHPSQVGQLYRRAIAVLVPSLCYEVFPLIAAEALSHGTPVIARRIGALAEIVEQSGGGLTFDTLGECREAMERMRRGPEGRAAMGERGRRIAAENWTTDVHLARYLDLIRSLLSARAREADPGASGSRGEATTSRSADVVENRAAQ